MKMRFATFFALRVSLSFSFALRHLDDEQKKKRGKAGKRDSFFFHYQDPQPVSNDIDMKKEVCSVGSIEICGGVQSSIEAWLTIDLICGGTGYKSGMVTSPSLFSNS